jgi:hypothetical protein
VERTTTGTRHAKAGQIDTIAAMQIATPNPNSTAFVMIASVLAPQDKVPRVKRKRVRVALIHINFAMATTAREAAV